MELNHPVLEKMITSLEASIEFKEMCRINGFTTLSDIVELPVYMLEKKPGMNNHLLMELMDILKTHHIENMIQE
jgi:hypothetical protein